MGSNCTCNQSPMTTTRAWSHVVQHQQWTTCLYLPNNHTIRTCFYTDPKEGKGTFTSVAFYVGLTLLPREELQAGDVPRGGTRAQHLPFTSNKISGILSTQKIFEILTTPKLALFCNLSIRKDPKMHSYDP